MQTIRQFIWILGLVLPLGLARAQAPAEQASAGVAVRVKIEAQSLEGGLNEFAKQTGLQVIFRSEEAVGLRAPQLEGSFTAEAALQQLLADSGLRYEFVNARTVAIRAVKRSGAELKPTADASRDALRLARAAGESNSSATADAQTSNEDKTAGSAASGEGGKLDEIIVTATKRAERLIDVPASIAVVTAEEISRRGMVSAEDYLRGIPGVNQMTRQTGQTIVIRGIETSTEGQNFSSGPTVATYFGETPTTNTAGIGGGANVDVKLVDIERVEVLRGPQGTAFGSSSLGGAVRTIPVAPKLDRIEAKVGAGYSMTSGTGGDNHLIQAVGNVPLIDDKLAIRATAYQFEDSGFYRNIAGSDPAFLAGAAAFGAQSYAQNQDHVGTTEFTGGRIAALFRPTEDLKLSIGYLNQKTRIDGQGFANARGYDQTVLQVAPENTYRGQRGGVYDTDIELANATVEYNFGWANVLATYSHIDSGSLNVYTSSSPSLVFAMSVPDVSDHRENSGEIRFTTDFDGAWNVVGGIYAEKLHDDLSTTLVWFGDPNPFGAQPVVGTYADSRNLEQQAAFTEVSWKFLPGFTLTGGLRAYEYKRTGHTVTSGLYGATDEPTQAAKTSGNSVRANLSYKPNENATLYAAWSQGFRLGKPQPGLPPGLCDLDNDGVIDGTGTTIERTKSVDSDNVDNAEIGAKLELLDRRMTVSADVFRIDWSGVPIRAIATCSTGDLAFTANAGSARSEGVEFQTNFFVTNALRVDVGGSWVQARLTKDAPTLLPPAFKDDRLPGSPKVNANLGLQYEFAVGSFPAFVRADSTYIGTFFGDVQELAINEAGGYVKVDASARVAIRNFTVDLFARNLANQDDFTVRGTGVGNSGQGNFYGFRLRPRTIGIQLGYSFQ